MATDVLRLALAQITSGDNLEENLKLVERLYRQADTEGADLVVFPENTLYFRVRSEDVIEGVPWPGPEVERLKAMVDRGSAAMMLTTPVQEAVGKPSNSTLLFAPRRPAENSLFALAS